MIFLYYNFTRPLLQRKQNLLEDKKRKRECSLIIDESFHFESTSLIHETQVVELHRTRLQKRNDTLRSDDVESFCPR